MRLSAHLPFGRYKPSFLTKKVAAHLVNLLEGTSTRLVVVGGAGTLFVDGNGTMVMDTPDFSAAYMGVGRVIF